MVAPGHKALLVLSPGLRPVGAVEAKVLSQIRGQRAPAPFPQGENSSWVNDGSDIKHGTGQWRYLTAGPQVNRNKGLKIDY